MNWIEYFVIGVGIIAAVVSLVMLAIYGRSVHVNRKLPPPGTFE